MAKETEDHAAAAPIETVEPELLLERYLAVEVLSFAIDEDRVLAFRVEG